MKCSIPKKVETSKSWRVRVVQVLCIIFGIQHEIITQVEYLQNNEHFIEKITNPNFNVESNSNYQKKSWWKQNKEHYKN